MSAGLVGGVLALPEVALAAAVTPAPVAPPALAAGAEVPARANGAAVEPAAHGALAASEDGPSDLRLDGVGAHPIVHRARTGFDPASSRLVSRAESSEVYANLDGTQTVRLSSAPKYAQTGPDQWSPIDTTLTAALPVDVPAAGRAAGQLLAAGRKAAMHPLSPVFGTNTLGGSVAVSHGPVSMRTTPATLAGLPAGLLSSVARQLPGQGELLFPGAFGASDLRYEVTPGAVKETVVVPSRLAAGTGAWSFLLDLVGGTPRLEPDGSIAVRAADGSVQLSLPLPYVFDSSAVEGQREAADVNGTYQLTQLGGRWLVTVQVPTAWLDAPARVWPVQVDPTVTNSADGVRAFKSDGTVVTDGYLRIGNPLTSPAATWRSTMHFPYEQYLSHGNQLVAADVDYTSDTNTAASYLSTFNYATAFNYNGLGQQLSAATIASTATLSGAGNNDFFRSLFNTNGGGANFMATGDNNPNIRTYKHMVASLTLTLDAPPSSPTALAPADGVANQSVETTLSSSAATDPDGDQVFYQFQVYNPNNSIAWQSDQQPDVTTVKVPPNTLTAGITYTWRVFTTDYCKTSSDPCHYGGLAAGNSPLRSFTVQTTVPPAVPSSSARPTGTIGTLTPTLTGAAVTGQGEILTYKFTVASGQDGRTGAIISSDYLPSPSWQVPAGYLHDGTRYTWTVWSYDGLDRSQQVWSLPLQIDLRAGDPRSSPTDTAGPVTVNLTNGNAIVSASSPSASFARTSATFGFTYNSQAAVAPHGLTATYYPDDNKYDGALDDVERSRQLMQRLEPNIDDNWGVGSPRPGVVPNDQFIVEWTGLLSLPPSWPDGNYQIGTVNDDSMRVWVGTPEVQVQNAPCCSVTPTWSTAAVALNHTTSPKIRVQLSEATFTSYAQLWIRPVPGSLPAGATAPPTGVISADMLTPTADTALPAGWSLSTDIDGTAPYLRADVTDQTITLIDDSGASHAWARKTPTPPPGTAPTTGTTAPTLGWTPPAGEQGTLNVEPLGALAADGVTPVAGQITLLEEDGSRSTFAADGTLRDYVPLDVSNKPAPLRYDWNASRLTAVTDQLSGLKVQLFYGPGTDAAGCNTAGVTTPPDMSATAPPGKLCRILYPDNRLSRLWYDPNGRLGQITDPGEEITQFGYDDSAAGAGRLNRIRDPLTADTLSRLPLPTPDVNRVADHLATQISYRPLQPGDPAPRVDHVTMTPATYTPTSTAAQLDATRMTHQYTYASTVAPDNADLNATGTTQIAVGGPARTVTYNARLQALTDTDPTGVTSSTSYRDDDQLLKTTDPTGRVTATGYDPLDRAVASYGPAPAACFTTSLTPVANPETACGSPVPTSTTGYDEDMHYLHTTWS